MMTEKMFKELKQSELEKTIGGSGNVQIVGVIDWLKIFNKAKNHT